MVINFYCVLGFFRKVYGVIGDFVVFGKTNHAYSTWSVIIFSIVERLSNPNGPPFFSLKVVG
jgi:hypothetical protein